MRLQARLAVYAAIVAVALMAATVLRAGPDNPLSMTEWRTTAQQMYPPAANGVSVTPNSSADTYSSWVQVIASTSTAWVLTGASVIAPNNAAACDTYIYQYVISVGVGGSGSEVEIAQLQGGCGRTDSGMAWIPASVPVDNIPAGSRVSVRLKKHTTDTTTWTVALGYLAKPVVGIVAATAQASTGYVWNGPSGANSAWANSAWSQLISSTSSQIAIDGYTLTSNQALDACDANANVDTEVDFGTGASGFESVVSTSRSMFIGSNGPQPFVQMRPILLIPTSTRVAWRFRRNNTSTRDCFMALHYYSSPETSVQNHLGTSQVETWTPSAADALTLTSGTATWASGSYTQFIASTSSQIAVTHLEVATTDGGGGPFEIDIATGGSGSEVVAGTVRFGAFSSYISFGATYSIPVIPAIVIPTSTRVSMRIRYSASSGGGRTATVAMGSIASPTFAQRSQQVLAQWPAAANGGNVTPSGTAWTSSSWVQLTAATTETDLVQSIGVDLNHSGSYEAEVDLGTGASGFEVVADTYRFGYMSGGGVNLGPNRIVLVAPLYIPTGTRISVRMRKSDTDTSVWRFSAEYLHAPSGFPGGGFQSQFITGLATPFVRLWQRSAWQTVRH